MPTVKFVNEKKSIEVPQGSNLRKEALKAGIELYPGINQTFNCHGFGTCASCRVIVKNGKENINKQGLFEKIRLILGPITIFARFGNEDTLRFACKTKVNGDCEIETRPFINWFGDRFWG